MKGALIKELNALKSNRSILLAVVYAFLIFVSLLIKGSIFLFVPLIIAFIAPLTYASHDEKYGWKDFAKTLPFTVAQRVAARYIICFAELAVAVVVRAIAAKIDNTLYDIVIAHYVLMYFFVGALAQAVILFLCYKFKRGLRTFLGIVSVVLFSCVIVVFIDGNAMRFFGGVNALYVFEPWFACLSAVVGFALLVLSYLLVVRSETPKNEKKRTMRKTLISTSVSLAVAACVSVCVLGVKGRLVPEPILDYDFGLYEIIDEEQKIAQLYNFRKTSNLQNLSRIEMFDALRKLEGKTIWSEDGKHTKEVLEQAGFKAWDFTGLLVGYDGVMCSSKYSCVSGSFMSGDFVLNSSCPAKYVAVTDNDDMIFVDKDFKPGITEAELIDLLEEKGLSVCWFEEIYGYYSMHHEYAVYIAYENVVTKEMFIEEIIFVVENGELYNYTRMPTNYNYESVVGNDKFVEMTNEYMMMYAEVFCDKSLVGMDMDACEQSLLEIGAWQTESNLFNSYALGEAGAGQIEISFDELSAYPGKVGFIKASGFTGAKQYETMSEAELAAIRGMFRTGMTDKELVELLKENEFYPTSINESIDYSYNPEKIYKCYSLAMEFLNYENMGVQSCEIRVELYDGVVTNTLVYLDGLIDPEPTVQYMQLEKLWDNLELNISEGMPLPELVDAFEKNVGMSTDSVEPEWDGLLFEACEWNGDFVFSLVRQIGTGYNDEFYQLRMDIYFNYNESLHKDSEVVEWGDVGDAAFFGEVRKSSAYNALKDAAIVGVEIYITET